MLIFQVYFAEMWVGSRVNTATTVPVAVPLVIVAVLLVTSLGLGIAAGCCRYDLTRFNKIATQGAPQMAVDKEANSLSRVYSYYSKFNLRLFYV